MNDLDAEYTQLMQSKKSARFAAENAEALSGVPVHLEATIPPKTNPDMNAGNTRSNEELAAMGLDYAKLGLEKVGKAGKAAMEAVSPSLDAAGKAIGLELPKGGMEKATSFVTGTPDTGQSDVMAGVSTIAAGLPLIGAMGKAIKPLAKMGEIANAAIKPVEAKAITKLAEESASSLYTNGGSTFSLTKGNMMTQPAYAVSVMPELRAYVPGHATPKDIEAFVKSLDGKVDLNNDMFNIGTWFDKSKGHTELTVSLTLNTLDDALAVAKAHGESSIYSLGSGEEIFTGAKGQSGKINTLAAFTLASSMAGGAFGYKMGAEDEKVKSTLEGAGLGLLAPMAIPLAKAMMRGKILKGSTKGTGAGALTKEEIASPLSQIAKDYRSRVADYTRGVRPHALAREEAAKAIAAGEFSDEYLATALPGTTYNDTERLALREVMAQEGVKLKALGANFMLTPGNKELEQEYLKQLATYAHIAPVDIGASTEAGRTLSVQNDLENEVNIFVQRMSGAVSKIRATQSPLRMAQITSATPTLAQLHDFARRVTAPGLTDMLAESWINGLLSQPITHVTNTTSNLLTVLTSIPERAIAQGFGAITPGPAGVVAGETSALVRGYMNSVSTAWLTAAKAFHTDAPLFGAQKMETRTQSISQHNFDLALQRAGLDPLLGSWTKVFDYIGTAARVPGRLLMAEDEFFKAVAVGGEGSAQAWRAAALDIGSTGIQGKALRDGIDARYNQIMADPNMLSAYAKDAEGFASYITFTNNLGPTGQAVQEAINSHPLLKVIAPFIRTPVNIAKYAGERTPFALLAKSVRDDIAAGGAKRDLALAKLGAGSSIMAAFSVYSAAGVLTGFGPADKETRAIWQTDGRRPYSINVTALARLHAGGSPEPVNGDTWLTYSRIDPIGMLIGLAADTTDIYLNQDDPEVADHLGARLTLVGSHVIASKTYVKGIAEWMFAAADPEHYGGKLEESLARTLVTTVPAVGPATKFLQRSLDPMIRETTGVIDAIKTTIPGLSSTLPPKRNYWGEVQMKEGWQVGPFGLENAVSPLYRSTTIKDDVVKQLVEDKVNLTPPRDTIGKVKLSPQQYDYLRMKFGEVTAGGQNVHQAFESILAKYPTPTTDPQSIVHLLLKQREDVYKTLAREEMYKKYPQLRDATGRLTAIEKGKSLSTPPPSRGVSEIRVE